MCVVSSAYSRAPSIRHPGVCAERERERERPLHFSGEGGASCRRGGRGGEGHRPTPSRLYHSQAHTHTASITHTGRQWRENCIERGQTQGNEVSVWDLRVGSARLKAALATARWRRPPPPSPPPSPRQPGLALHPPVPVPVSHRCGPARALPLRPPPPGRHHRAAPLPLLRPSPLLGDGTGRAGQPR